MFACVQLGLLMLSLLPLLVTNMRHGTVPNPWLAMLLIVGLGVAAFGDMSGAEPLTYGTPIWWIAGVVTILGLSVLGVVPGGVAKFLIALIPWFELKDYLLLVTFGMLLAGAIAKLTKRNAPIVPPFTMAALGLGLWDIVAG